MQAKTVMFPLEDLKLIPFSIAEHKKNRESKDPVQTLN
jgi:hypothetical protein